MRNNFINDGIKSGWGSHLRMHNDILSVINQPDNAIEFGGGYWSTPFLLEKCKQLTTIEHGNNSPKEINDKWMAELWIAHGQTDNWTFLPQKRKDWKKLEYNQYDYAFVDCSAEERDDIIQKLMLCHVPVIVRHDTYGLDTYQTNGYIWINHEVDNTCVFTTNEKLAKHLLTLPIYKQL